MWCWSTLSLITIDLSGLFELPPVCAARQFESTLSVFDSVVAQNPLVTIQVTSAELPSIILYMSDSSRNPSPPPETRKYPVLESFTSCNRRLTRSRVIVFVDDRRSSMFDANMQWGQPRWQRLVIRAQINPLPVNSSVVGMLIAAMSRRRHSRGDRNGFMGLITSLFGMP